MDLLIMLFFLMNAFLYIHFRILQVTWCCVFKLFNYIATPISFKGTDLFSYLNCTIAVLRYATSL